MDNRASGFNKGVTDSLHQTITTRLGPLLNGKNYVCAYTRMYLPACVYMPTCTYI